MTFNHIKNIVEKNITEEVHNAFTRYSIGVFKKEPFTVKLSAKEIVLKAGFEYLNFLHRFLAAHSSGEMEIEGAIESVKDLSPLLQEWKLETEEKSRFGKAGKKYILAPQMLHAAAYKELVEKLFTEYLLFHAAGKEGQLKVKSQTTPKLGSTTDGFVTLKLDASVLPAVRKNFLFDAESEAGLKTFTAVTIEHIYFIREIEIDEALLRKDAARARKEARRVGEIQRKITADGKVVKEYVINFKV